MCNLLQNALSADAAQNLSDGDYRTYALIATLAVESKYSWTDLSYEEIADGHPGNARLSGAAVRARVGRLTDAGLLRRERIGRTRWRTWILPLVVATRESTQASENSVAVIQISSQEYLVGSTVMPSAAATPSASALGAMRDSTQESAKEPLKGMRTIADNTHTSILRIDAMAHSSQVPVPATSAHTQPNDLILEQHDRSVNGNSLPNQFQSGQAHPNSKAAIVAELENELRQLMPKPMNAAGIAECLRAPELTAAWLSWAMEPANGVTSPAAYVRSQVRRGQFPPHAEGERSNHGNRERGEHAPVGVHSRAGTTRSAPAGVAVATGRTSRWPLDAGAL